MVEIKVNTQSEAYEASSFTFPGGEPQVQIPGLPEIVFGNLRVAARLQSSDSIIRLLLATEILSRAHVTGSRSLLIPYLPFARQDRVMLPSEAFSLKVMTRLINALDYDLVTICDPHSDVAAALIDRVEVVSQLELIEAHDALKSILASPFLSIVAPDAGAGKKAFAVAQRFGLPLITASKLRDVSTGDITHTQIHDPSSVCGRDMLIVDDICDGGRTFIELAKVLKDAGAEKIYLYVTHGIFSKGLGVFKDLIDGVFSTDSFLSRDVESPPQSPVPLFVQPLNF